MNGNPAKGFQWFGLKRSDVKPATEDAGGLERG